MASSKSKPELIAIVGPTASGKSELAMELAKKFDGEIITADSRTIFKGLDIGTAKPSGEGRETVPHWGLDLVEPGEVFTAAEFQRYAKSKIEAIKNRNHLPILVGGTGLYIDSILYDFQFGPQADQDQRAKLEALNIEELQRIIGESKVQMPENSRNKRHLIRAIERDGYVAQRSQRPCYEAIIIGLLPPDNILRRRIDQRAEDMFRGGVMEETAGLMRKYPKTSPQSVGLIYKICSKVLNGEADENEAIEKFKTLDWQYARRQKTWFKRNPDIHWFESLPMAKNYVEKVLNT